MVSAPRAAVRAQEVAGVCRPWLVQDLCSDLLSRWVMGAIRPQPRGSAVEACAPGCPSSFLVLYQRAGLMVPSFPITFLTQEYCSWKMSQGPLPTTPPSTEGPWRGGKAHLQGHTRGQELNPNSILPAAMDLCTTLPLPPPALTSPALGSSRGWLSAQLLWQLITRCDSLRELSRTLLALRTVIEPFCLVVCAKAARLESVFSTSSAAPPRCPADNWSLLAQSLACGRCPWLFVEWNDGVIQLQVLVHGAWGGNECWWQRPAGTAAAQAGCLLGCLQLGCGTSCTLCLRNK